MFPSQTDDQKTCVTATLFAKRMLNMTFQVTQWLHVV